MAQPPLHEETDDAKVPSSVVVVGRATTPLPFLLSKMDYVTLFGSSAQILRQIFLMSYVHLHTLPRYIFMDKRHFCIPLYSTNNEAPAARKLKSNDLVY